MAAWLQLGPRLADMQVHLLHEHCCCLNSRRNAPFDNLTHVLKVIRWCILSAVQAAAVLVQQVYLHVNKPWPKQLFQMQDTMRSTCTAVGMHTG